MNTKNNETFQTDETRESITRKLIHTKLSPTKFFYYLENYADSYDDDYPDDITAAMIYETLYHVKDAHEFLPNFDTHVHYIGKKLQFRLKHYSLTPAEFSKDSGIDIDTIKSLIDDTISWEALNDIDKFVIKSQLGVTEQDLSYNYFETKLFELWSKEKGYKITKAADLSKCKSLNYLYMHYRNCYVKAKAFCDEFDYEDEYNGGILDDLFDEIYAGTINVNSQTNNTPLNRFYATVQAASNVVLSTHINKLTNGKVDPLIKTGLCLRLIDGDMIPCFS